MFEEMNKKMELLGLVPVIKISNADEAIPLGKALIAGGLKSAEVCFRVDADVEDQAKALQNIADGIAAMRKAYPEMTVGAGTVINPDLAKKAIAAGAQFIVSPGFNPSTVDYCIKENVPVYPGVNCSSQIEQAIMRGLSLIKFFPAEASGGVKTLNALGGPFPTMKFMATGGVNASNIGDYMQCKNIAAVGGSWMVKDSLIKGKQWDEITKLSKSALKAMLGFEFAHVGLNFDSATESASAAEELAIFGFDAHEGSASWHSGVNGLDTFELTKSKGRGEKGHIGINVYSIERTLEYLKSFGYKAITETKKWSGVAEKSNLVNVYLDKSFAGFAIHLNRK
jgi:2-dehydro-3-deoxyphosphogluconate aldolase/(4S)-4-hydroxy-2-oxoglutarate aldolase